MLSQCLRVPLTSAEVFCDALIDGQHDPILIEPLAGVFRLCPTSHSYSKVSPQIAYVMLGQTLFISFVGAIPSLDEGKRAVVRYSVKQRRQMNRPVRQQPLQDDVLQYAGWWRDSAGFRR